TTMSATSDEKAKDTIQDHKVDAISDKADATSATCDTSRSSVVLAETATNTSGGDDVTETTDTKHVPKTASTDDTKDTKLGGDSASGCGSVQVKQPVVSSQSPLQRP